MKTGLVSRSRVSRFLEKMTGRAKPGWTYADAADPRQVKKVTHAMSSVLWTLELALTANQRALRDAEQLTHGLCGWARRLVPEPISDTTLDTLCQELDVDDLLARMRQRVRGFQRSKMLEPVGLPCGVVTIDGKNLATLDHDADGTGHRRSGQNEKWHLSKAEEGKRGTAYFLMPALRAVLTSAEARPCIDQLALPPGTGESTSFGALLERLDTSYGRARLFEIVDGDAGLTSLCNADRVAQADYHYVFGLKGNQPELFGEANALLLPLAVQGAPEVETTWEVRNGKRIRRRLWRTGEMAGMETSAGTWGHLRQTWLVRQETKNSKALVDVEDRLFLTSVPLDFLTPEQILRVVRNHWAVENDCFNSLDIQWREDHGPWCTRGRAVWALGVLRLMAYNTAQLLRRRRLRRRREDGTRCKPIAWRMLFRLIEQALVIEDESFGVCTG